MPRSPLHPLLPSEFSTAEAVALGVSEKRLRGDDLEAPFRGARMMLRACEDPLDRYEAAKDRELRLIRALASRLVDGQFISHRSAAMLWGAPMPFRSAPELHAGVKEPMRTPRIRGVSGHAFAAGRATLREMNGIRLTSPETTFASLGVLPLPRLVALGDYLVRMYRQGYGRPNAGMAPITTLEALADAVELGRWRGMPVLRRGLELIREDSWSPRESMTRVELVRAGLPEPELNVDVFDRSGCFLGCLDMLYPRYRVAVEYQGRQHEGRYSDDVERYEALKAEEWDVILVTRALASRPGVLVGRVGAALRRRGWTGVV